MPYYAVRAGRHPGVYTSRRACGEQVDGYRHRTEWKKFDSRRDAYDYLDLDEDSYVDGYVKDVYTDGACLNNGYHGAAAGIGVFWGDDDCRNVSERHEGRQTNNSAEIHAAIRAINKAYRAYVPEINLHTDSRFLIDAVKKGWIDDWRENGWRTVDGYSVKNKEDFQELDRRLYKTRNYLKIHWIHVRAHSGDYGNDQADELARDGCLM